MIILDVYYLWPKREDKWIFAARLELSMRMEPPESMLEYAKRLCGSFLTRSAKSPPWWLEDHVQFTPTIEDRYEGYVRDAYKKREMRSGDVIKVRLPLGTYTYGLTGEKWLLLEHEETGV